MNSFGDGAAGDGRSEKSVDWLHIGNGVIKAGQGQRAGENWARTGIGLQSILVGWRDLDHYTKEANTI